MICTPLLAIFMMWLNCAITRLKSANKLGSKVSYNNYDNA